MVRGLQILTKYKCGLNANVDDIAKVHFCLFLSFSVDMTEITIPPLTSVYEFGITRSPGLVGKANVFNLSDFFLMR